MPDEFTKVRGLHRKAAIRLLGKPAKKLSELRGRKREYMDLVELLKTI